MQDKEVIFELVEKLRQSGIVVVVEGPNDRAALNELGITNIVMLSKKPLYAVIESLSDNSEVIILTDLDKKGKELYHMLAKGLQDHGVHINNELRHALFRAKLSHVEGLATFLKKV